MGTVAIFPPAHRHRRIDAGLLQAVATALAELGDIELPDSAPTAEDARNLDAIAPLYLAHELEQAGVLRTAELIAGLFAGGTITQPLGPAAKSIADFWKARHERLAAAEREQLFAQVFDPGEFYPLMQTLCDALADQLDNPPRTGDVHGRVALQEAAAALGAWLAPHAVGMVQFAARDILQSLSQATHFLRDRLLQTAFGVHDLWGLVGAVGSARGANPAVLRRHVELGRQGAAVLGWLAGSVTGNYALDPASEAGQRLMTAAEAWRVARAGLAAQEAPVGAPSAAARADAATSPA